MTLDEIADLIHRSRRTVMRRVDEGKLPQPVETNPMSWDRTAVKAAYKVMREEALNERKQKLRARPRNGRKHRKAPSVDGSRA
jgi:hypothetical protein